MSGADEQSALRRRWRWLAPVAGLVLVLIGVGLWGWFRWWPDHRPGLRAGERYGVDVSNHQGAIDWARVADDDIDFAYIKATEGGDFVDARFARNWQGAGRAGLRRGAYHFFTLCRPGEEQAANFVRTLPDDPDSLPPAVDVELGGNCSARPPRQRIERELRRFIDDVESASGRRVVVYVVDDFEGRYHLRDDLDRPVWHRRIGLRRPEVADWWIWQFSFQSHVAGIDGGVDLNVMRGSAPPG